MKSVTEILKDIAFVKNDITELRKLGGSAVYALDDLEDLYSELRIAKENSNNVLEDNVIAFKEYEDLYNENQKLLKIISTHETTIKQLKKKADNDNANLQKISVTLEDIKNRGLWQRIINKS